jgi:hypothetical protein
MLRELQLMMTDIREDEFEALEDALPGARVINMSGRSRFGLPRKARSGP